MTIIEEISAERIRQMNVEGWTTEHDDRHDMGELANAAACYAMTPAGRDYYVADAAMKKVWRWLWPWPLESWRPKDRRRDLIRAAALIVAEIERLDRIGEKS